MQETFSLKINHISKVIKKYWFIYLLVIPGFIYIFIFRYIPIYGIMIAFKKFSITKGIWNSPWVGLENFKVVFQSAAFYKVIWNTVVINIYNIVFGSVIVIFLALMLNEMKNQFVKKIIQTIVYLPNFISWIVMAGMVIIFLSPSEGLINKIIVMIGGESIYFLIKKEYFRVILVITSIVKTAGFGTILYLASISGIDPCLYESAVIDGANRKDMIIHITLPRLYPTIAVMTILSISHLFSSNFELVFTLYNPLVYETGDVLSTYLYRIGMLEAEFEQSTALNLVFSCISVFTIFFTNKAVKKMDVTGIF